MTTKLASSIPSVSGVTHIKANSSALALWYIDSCDPPPSEGSFIALAAGTDVAMLSVSLPPTLKGRAREEVAIRQLCDRLNARPETLRVLPMSLPGAEESWTSALVATNEVIATWLRRLGSADARCQAILPDYLALPSAPRLWTIAVSQSHGRTIVKVRLGVADGFTAESILAAFALARARSTLPAPEAVLCIGPLAPAVEAALEGLPLIRSLQALPKDQAAAGIFQQGEEIIDLRRQRVHQPAPPLVCQFPRLRWSLLLFVLGTIAWGASIEVETRRYRAEADSIKDNVIAMVRQNLLPSEPIVDLRVQVEREMERLHRQLRSYQKTSEMLERFRQITHVLANQDDIEIVSAVLVEGEGISLNVLTPDFTTLDAVTSHLRETEGELRILRSTTETGGRVGGSVFISLKAVDE